jgi:hypothetical protein
VYCGRPLPTFWEPAVFMYGIVEGLKMKAVPSSKKLIKRPVTKSWFSPDPHNKHSNTALNSYVIQTFWGGGGPSCFGSGISSSLIEIQCVLYANFEANKMSLHQYIQRSHVLVLNLTFDLAFLKRQNSNSFQKKRCVHVTTIKISAIIKLGM